MRIAVVAGYAPSLTNFRGPLLRALVNAGHDVVALAPDMDDETLAALHKMSITAESIPLERAGMNPWRDLRAATTLARRLRALHPDVSFTYTVKPVVYGTLAASIARVPRRVAMVTGLGHAFIDTEDRKRSVAFIVRALYRLALRFCDVVIFHNDDDRLLFENDNLVPRDGRAVVVGGSGVDTRHFALQPLPEGPTRFLLIARLLAEKGVREYVEAARIVRRTHPDTVFELVGPLDANPSAIGEDEVRRWQNEGLVDYRGALSDVREAIARCHVYVLPSYREGLPRTNLEAMSCGRAVITTDVPGCRQTVKHGENGLLVPVRDARALAEACTTMLREPARIATMGQRSRTLVEERYSIEEVNRAMMRHITGSSEPSA